MCMCMCMHTNEEFLQNTKADSLLNTITVYMLGLETAIYLLLQLKSR